MGDTFKNHLLGKGLSNATVEAYLRESLEFLAWLGEENVEPDNAGAADITAYMSHLKKKGLSNLTRGLRLNVLKHFFDYRTECGGRATNPATHVKIRGGRRNTLYPTLSVGELESIYHGYGVPGPEDGKSNRNWFRVHRLSRQRNKTILGLMVWQGLRTPEINRLSLADVRLREGTVYIAGSRKSAERTLELKPWQITELMEYRLTTRAELLGQSPDRTGLHYVPSPSAGKKTVTGNDGINIWKRLGGELRTTTPRFVNFRQVRASVITHWLGRHNLREVQYMAGHKYVGTTEGYLVNRVDDLRADIDRFHPVT